MNDKFVKIENKIEELENELAELQEEMAKKENIERMEPMLNAKDKLKEEFGKIIQESGRIEAFHDWLNDLIKKQYEENKLLEEKNVLIQEFMDYFSRLLRNQFVMQQLNFHLFGSIVNGFGTNNSDLDICLLDTGLETNHSQRRNKKNRVKFLRRIAKKLQGNYNFCEITHAFHARIPIIKCEYAPDDFKIDICVENKLAIFNSKLLKLYSEFDERVPILGSAIKQWAKLFGLHGASSGLFSSYALNVMLIHYLQQIQPPVLPFLQEPSNNSKTIINESIEGCEVKFEQNIKMLKEGSTFCNDQTLAQLFIGFFNFYATKFSLSKYNVQIRSSKDLNKSHENTTGGFQFFIQDPFESRKLSSGDTEEKRFRIRECFVKTNRGLKKFGKDYFPENSFDYQFEEGAGCSYTSKTTDGNNVALDDMNQLLSHVMEISNESTMEISIESATVKHDQQLLFVPMGVFHSNMMKWFTFNWQIFSIDSLLNEEVSDRAGFLERYSARSNLPIPPFNSVIKFPMLAFYYEMEILNGDIGIWMGFAKKDLPLHGEFIGFEEKLIGIWTKNTILIEEAPHFNNCNGHFNKNDVVGIGIIHYPNMKIECFSTLNGKLLKKSKLPPHFSNVRLYPTVSIFDKNDSIRVIFEKEKWKFTKFESLFLQTKHQ